MEEEKRKRGRPKKDEIVAKPFVPHTKPQIKDKNKAAYAKKAIRRAEQLYRLYDEKRPNPLNIDEKDLSEEAKMLWKYIFSMRDEVSESKNVKALRSTDEILLAFEGFCMYIRKNNFVKPFIRPDGSAGVIPIVPNITNLAMWLGITRQTMSGMLRSLSAEEEREYKSMLSDLLSDGALIGVYNTSSAIFTLKNLCDWADKREDRIVQVEDNSSVEEAKNNLEALGYVRPRLLEGGRSE